MLQERWYQTEADEATWRYLHEKPPGNNPLIGMPTGTGKSVVITKLIKRAMFTYPGTTIAAITHVKELVDQNCKALLRAWPQAPVGVYSDGLNRKETHQPIIFGGIQSMVNVAPVFGKRGIVLVDEAHLVPPDSNAMYQNLFDVWRAINPDIRFVGYTATGFRSDGPLHGPGKLFTEMAYDLTGVENFNRLVREGYLAPLIPKQTDVHLDVSGVKVVNGDYAKGELQAAVDKDAITRAALREAAQYGEHRRSWLVFASGVNHAEHIADILNEMGISAVAVHGKLPTKKDKNGETERDRRVRAYKQGRVRAIVNFNVLTTGFDDPKTDMIVMLRPTQSPGLWVQMLGRGTRPLYAPGYDLNDIHQRLLAIQASPKRNCLVMDFAWNSAILGPINDPVLPKGKKKKGGTEGIQAPAIKICRTDNTTWDMIRNPFKKNGCGCFNHVQARFCDQCGNEFIQSVKIEQTASTGVLIREDSPQEKEPEEPKFEVRDVIFVVYSKHKTAGRPPVLRVDYTTFDSTKPVSEWVHLESSFKRFETEQWWLARHNSQCPKTVDEALQYNSQLRKPSRIKVWVNHPSGYPMVMSHEY